MGQVFDSLGAFDQARSLYAQAINFAEVGHYVQVQAKALTGLAVLERHSTHYAEAVRLHCEAVTLCEKIGAKCDLAEAYFQMGLSRRLANEADAAVADCFSRAIALFLEICAPQQVARVVAAQMST